MRSEAAGGGGSDPVGKTEEKLPRIHWYIGVAKARPEQARFGPAVAVETGGWAAHAHCSSLVHASQARAGNEDPGTNNPFTRSVVSGQL